MKTKTCIAAIVALALIALGGCATRGGYGIDPRHDISDSIDAEESLAEPANERSTYLALIRRMQRDGMYYASLAHVDAFVIRHGSSIELELLRCDGLRGSTQYAAAEACYRKLVSTRHAPAAAWHGLGVLLGRLGDFDEASSSLAEAVRRAPADANFLSDYGYASLRAGRRDEARIAITKAAELDPTNHVALSNLAVYLYSRGDAKEAEMLMEKAQLSAPTRESVRELSAHIIAMAKPAPVAAAATAPEQAEGASTSVPASTPRRESPTIRSIVSRFNGH